MFRVTVDVFSGRPNPSWIVTDEAEGQAFLKGIAEIPDAITKPDSGFGGLGYRGVEIELFGDEDSSDLKLPASFVFANAAGPNLERAADLAARLISNMTKYEKIVLPEHQLTPIDGRIQEFVLEQLKVFVRNPPKRPGPVIKPKRLLRRTVHDQRCDQCQYEISRFNPSFWNSDSNVRRNNNCYNYARNWRTNTFAQPGRAHGCYPYPMQSNDVSNAALCDGLKKRCDCLPETEYPRRHVALVIAPSIDYHWYREQIGGFWGHKPGQTEAKNTDNSGNLITNPETCDRGMYTVFSGYFYAGKSVVIA
jgi:hypothetical protein